MQWPSCKSETTVAALQPALAIPHVPPPCPVPGVICHVPLSPGRHPRPGPASGPPGRQDAGRRTRRNQRPQREHMAIATCNTCPTARPTATRMVVVAVLQAYGKRTGAGACRSWHSALSRTLRYCSGRLNCLLMLVPVCAPHRLTPPGGMQRKALARVLVVAPRTIAATLCHRLGGCDRR